MAAQSLALKVAEQRRVKAATAWALAHAHPLGSVAYAAHLREHGHWINAAQRAEGGDTTPRPWVAQ